MTNRTTLNRSARRTESQPAESDVAAVFERRLLARGVRTDDFLDWRNSTDLPPIPSITPIRFGRGSSAGAVDPIAAPESETVAPSDEIEPAESGSN